MTDYKLVPVEPTPEMLDAAVQDGICVDGKPVWKRDVEFQAKWKYQQMLAAAPTVKAEQAAGVPEGWRPIETAPKDNLRPIWIAQFDRDGALVDIDSNAIWQSEQESWEIPQTYYFWASDHGRVEEPTHWAYMGAAPAQPAAQDQGEVKGREALAGLLAIVDDSRGVAGYHLNGTIADWDEFPEVESARAMPLPHQRRAPMTDTRIVPLELLQDIRDLASDTVEHHRPFASHKSGRQERMDKVIRAVDKLLAAAPTVKAERVCETDGTVSELLAAIMHFGSEKWAEGRGAADPELANVRAAWDSVYSLVQDLATRPEQTEQQAHAVLAEKESK